jgi:hypothetical protein
MISIQQRVDHLSCLGERMVRLSGGLGSPDEQFLMQRAMVQNQWFTMESISQSLYALGQELTSENIGFWLSKYVIPENTHPKTIGLVLAGNIPLVGLHDILCVLISGHKALVKLSVKDQELYHVVKNVLVGQSFEYTNLLTFTDANFKNVDAIIATGSDNTSRYFEYYFAKYPNIIRKNRTSVALLSGNESDEDLTKLADDIFSYFGLGCRNVAHLLVPEGYSFDNLLRAIEPYHKLIQHNKYANNYDYQKVVNLMNHIEIKDTGFVLLKETEQLQSPVGVIHFHAYNTMQQAIEYIDQHTEKIQCIITTETLPFTTFAFGEAQKPALWDYADHVDTLKFLLNLK